MYLARNNFSKKYKSMLQEITISEFENSKGTVQNIHLSYQIFGRELGTAPIVLVNHSLSGNSEITGKNGWWNEIVGEGKSVDPGDYTILALDMPGNGFSGKPANLLHNYKEFTLRDIAKIFVKTIERLEITEIFAGIGGSIGGALLWELAVLKPSLIRHIIPIATDYKATHWVKAICKVQDQILNNSAEPVKDARMHAMTFYRSPQSFTAKFGNLQEPIAGSWDIERWLEHHGNKLEERFQLATYKLMNHLLTTIDISNGTGDHIGAAAKVEADIHIITVNSDRFFLPDDNWETFVNLSLQKKNVHIHEIKSLHGHDAFLIENAQLAGFLNPIFHTNNTTNEKNKHRALWSR